VIKALIGAAAAVVLATGAGGEPAAARSSTTAEPSPEWTGLPTAQDIARVYPEMAQRLALNGRAVLSCAVAPNATLEDCRVIEETPPGQGFGDAAMKLATRFRLKTWDRSTGGRVRGARTPSLGEPAARIVLPIAFRMNTPAEQPAAASGAALPPASPGASPTTPHPNWVRKPTGQDIADVYPARAQRDGVSGRAVMTCTLDQRGRLHDCGIVDETPPGYGFGSAELKLAGKFRAPITPGMETGGAKVSIPVTFAMTPGR
jgi:TonB family protein